MTETERVKVPAPGSPEAVEKGCKCGVLDNARGRGFPYGPNGKRSFWINGACKMHGKGSPPWMVVD